MRVPPRGRVLDFLLVLLGPLLLAAGIGAVESQGEATCNRQLQLPLAQQDAGGSLWADKRTAKGVVTQAKVKLENGVNMPDGGRAVLEKIGRQSANFRRVLGARRSVFMWMRRSLCVPVCVNCGMDCLTFCCFYPLGQRNVFFTLLPEKKKALDGYEWKQTAESSLQICHLDTY